MSVVEALGNASRMDLRPEQLERQARLRAVADADGLAGVIALGPAPSRYATAQRFYNRPTSLRDVVGGSNGFCGGDYLCTGLRGYDAPTGLGTPKGVTSVS